MSTVYLDAGLYSLAVSSEEGLWGYSWGVEFMQGARNGYCAASRLSDLNGAQKKSKNGSKKEAGGRNEEGQESS